MRLSQTLKWKRRSSGSRPSNLQISRLQLSKKNLSHPVLVNIWVTILQDCWLLESYFCLWFCHYSATVDTTTQRCQGLGKSSGSVCLPADLEKVWFLFALIVTGLQKMDGMKNWGTTSFLNAVTKPRKSRKNFFGCMSRTLPRKEPYFRLKMCRIGTAPRSCGSKMKTAAALQYQTNHATYE